FERPRSSELLQSAVATAGDEGLTIESQRRRRGEGDVQSSLERERRLVDGRKDVAVAERVSRGRIRAGGDVLCDGSVLHHRWRDLHPIDLADQERQRRAEIPTGRALTVTEEAGTEAGGPRLPRITV